MINQELEIVKNTIREGLEEILPDKALSSFIFGSSKYIRSRVALLYILSNGFQPCMDIYNILAATELIHNASLLHDDTIDCAETRRGTTAICKKFSSDISILSGDYLVSKAIDKLQSINNVEINKIFNDCIQNMSTAEIKQYFKRNAMPKLDDYIEICAGKTSSLFQAVLKSCAIIFNLSVDIADKFGYLLGIVFQINNDLNKDSVLSDKKNGINTAVNIIGVENAISLSDNYKEEIFELMNGLSDNNYKHELRDLIKKL